MNISAEYSQRLIDNSILLGSSNSGRRSPSLGSNIPSSLGGFSRDDYQNIKFKLDKKLGPEYISQRPGMGGGGKISYIEGWKAIELANEIFGFNGWSSTIRELIVDFIDLNKTGRYNCGVTAIVRVTLADGSFHEDVGFGEIENSPKKGAALDKCKKEAVTDSLKRTLRNFGNVLGNCLYDRNYANQIVKYNVAKPQLDKSSLYRRPEFSEPQQQQQPTNNVTKNNSNNIPQNKVVQNNNNYHNHKVQPVYNNNDCNNYCNNHSKTNDDSYSSMIWNGLEIGDGDSSLVDLLDDDEFIASQNDPSMMMPPPPKPHQPQPQPPQQPNLNQQQNVSDGSNNLNYPSNGNNGDGKPPLSKGAASRAAALKRRHESPHKPNESPTDQMKKSKV